MSNHWLAVDFGTSNSLAAAVGPEGVSRPLAIDPSAADPTILKSVIFSQKKGEWTTGVDAISLYYELGAEGRVFKSLKKFLPDPSFQGTQVHGAFFSLEDLLGRLLRTIRERAEKQLDRELAQVVLGHPALFAPQEDAHKKALARLEKAAQIAGFRHIEFCPEPVAAAYQFASTLSEPKTVLIADFGGGTSDFTVIRLRPEGFEAKDVLALGGLSVAGDAFDGCIMEHFVAPHFGSKVVFRMPYGTNTLSLPKALVRKMCSPADLLLLGRKEYLEFFRSLQQWAISESDSQAIARLEMLIEERQGYHLFQCIEEGKKALSDLEASSVDYDYPGLELSLPLSRKHFEEFSGRSVNAIAACLDQTVADSGLRYDDIDLVCCTGGTAKIPAIHAALAERLGTGKLKQHEAFHAVVKGLAERAHQLINT